MLWSITYFRTKALLLSLPFRNSSLSVETSLPKVITPPRGSSYLITVQTPAHNSRQLFGLSELQTSPQYQLCRLLWMYHHSASPFAQYCFPHSLKRIIPESTPKELFACRSPLGSEYPKDLDIWHIRCPYFLWLLCCCCSHLPSDEIKTCEL